MEAGQLTGCCECAVESPERKDSEAPVTILQLVKVPSVCVLLIASLLAAASLTFLDPLLCEHLRILSALPISLFNKLCKLHHSQMKHVVCLIDITSLWFPRRCCLCQVLTCRRSTASV